MTAAIILAGGRGARLGGVDKATIEVDGRMLIDHALAAVDGCTPVIVVGPTHLSRSGVVVVREDPPFGGPAAALLAALAALATIDDGSEPAEAAPDVASGADEIWLLACDLPRAEELVARLAAEPIPEGADALVAIDGEGRLQWLAGRYRLAALRTAAANAGDPRGMPLRALLSDLRFATHEDGGAAVDLDTWSAIEHHRRGIPPRPQEDTMAEEPTELDDWVAELAPALGLAADGVPIGLLLDLTREAAHGVTRPAGPLTTYLLGLAVANGMSMDEAAAATRAVIARRQA